jgi:hypothetical protein
MAEVGSARPRARSRPSRIDFLAVLLSLAPLGMLLAVAADPEVTRLVGISALGWVIGFTLAWTFLGVVAVARSHSPLARAIALLVFTIPAAVAAVVGPWLPLLQ